MPLHITAVNRSSVCIINSWHLEQKQIIRSVWCTGQLVAQAIEIVAITKEFTWETSENQDELSIFLNCSTSLPLWEHFVVKINLCPFQFVGLIVSFDCVDVLSSWVCDSTENIYWSISESTWWVIMTAYVQIWHLEPKINIWVIHFTFCLWCVLFFSWTCDDNEFFSKPTSRMTMSGMFHRISLNKLESIIDLNFIQRIKSFIVTLVITSSNKVELLWLWVLNTLEIVWETTIVVWLHLDCLHCLQFEI